MTTLNAGNVQACAWILNHQYKLNPEQQRQALDIYENDRGFAVKLRELEGELEPYNEMVVKPKVMERYKRYLIQLEERGWNKGTKFEIVLGPKYLQVVVDHMDKIWTPGNDSHSKGGVPTAGLRSSVKNVVHAITDELRRALRIANQQGRDLADLFKDFDVDGSGTIDKAEFLEYCGKIGINVKLEHVDMVWPMLDIDGNGSVDIDEFVAFYHTKKGDSAFKAKSSFKCVQMTNHNRAQRNQRIEKKTNLAVAISLISNHLRTQLKDFLKRNDLTRKGLFDLFDEDGGGTIDKNEYFIGLENCGIDISQSQLAVVWSMFDRKDEGEITFQDWEAFMNVKDWDYERMQDKYLSNLDQIDMNELAGLDKSQKSKPSTTLGMESAVIETKFANLQVKQPVKKASRSALNKLSKPLPHMTKVPYSKTTACSFDPAQASLHRHNMHNRKQQQRRTAGRREQRAAMKWKQRMGHFGDVLEQHQGGSSSLFRSTSTPFFGSSKIK